MCDCACTILRLPVFIFTQVKLAGPHMETMIVPKKALPSTVRRIMIDAGLHPIRPSCVLVSAFSGPCGSLTCTSRIEVVYSPHHVCIAVRSPAPTLDPLPLSCRPCRPSVLITPHLYLSSHRCHCHDCAQRRTGLQFQLAGALEASPPNSTPIPRGRCFQEVVFVIRVLGNVN